MKKEKPEHRKRCSGFSKSYTSVYLCK